MKYAVSTVCVAAFLAPMVATFAPVFSQHRTSSLAATTSDDVPDLVKAYSKVSAAKSTNLEVPTLPDPIPVIPEPVVVPEPEATVAAIGSATATPDMPDSATTITPLKMPEIDLPSFDFKSVQLPSIDFPTTTTPSGAVVLDMGSIKAQVAQNADVINAQFSGMNQFFKEAQKLSEAARSGSTSSPKSVANLIQEGLQPHGVQVTSNKAPTLAEFIASGGAGTGLDVVDAKTKFAMIVDNTAALFGKDLDGMSFPALQDLSPEATTAIAVASVSILLTAAQASKSNDEKVATPPGRDKKVDGYNILGEAGLEEVPVSVLAQDVKKMAEQINALSDETKKLRTDLKEAYEQIAQKELEVSKSKLKALDQELKLNQQIDDLQRKLQLSERKNAQLETALSDGDSLKATLADAMQKIADLEAKVNGASEAPAPAPPAPAPPAPAATVKAPKAKKAAAKKAKAAAKKVKVAPKPVEVEPFFAEKLESAPEANNPAAKKVKSKKAEVDSSTDDDWASLSDSTLSRKTVKELEKYLSEKGVKTTGDDGKVLKKALLVEAVRGL